MQTQNQIIKFPNLHKIKKVAKILSHPFSKYVVVLNLYQTKLIMISFHFCIIIIVNF